jgi:signal transduction histidine kinase
VRQIDCLFGTINYGGIECWQVICRDITEKRELEAQLVQSQKMAALGQLAAGVAHELNNPLGIIYNSAYYLKSATSSTTPKIVRHFDIMEEHIQRCQKIIRDLLNFSRAPNPVIDLKWTDPNELIDSCLNLMDKEIRSGGVHIIRDLEALPSLLADPARLSQVFFNFIVNAVQAMPQGGTLSIKTRLKELTETTLSVGSGSAIVVSFHDTGMGIPAEILPKIFTPFFTTKKLGEGVGLGLSVSYQIVKQHDGEIKVQSVPGAGTNFDLVLPLKAPYNE